MRTTLIAAVVAASLPALAAEPEVVEVGLGREKVLTVPGLQRVAVGDAAIADVKTIGSEQILVLGSSLGETTLQAVLKSGEKRSWAVEVIHLSLRDEILKQVAAQAAAWNRGDLAGFVSAYAPDAVFLSPSGVTKGRDQVRARYKQKYPDKKAMGTLALEPVDVRANGEAVSVAAKWTLTYPDKPAAGGHTVIVFMPLKEGWRIVHDASM